MLVKSPGLKKKIQSFDEKTLLNQVLVISFSATESGVSASAYTKPLSQILKTVESSCDSRPSTVEELVRQYAEIELALSNSDYVEVIGDQETANQISEELCEKSNNVECYSFDWLQAWVVGAYADYLRKQLPEKVEYLR